MRLDHDEAGLSLGPDQISILATLHDETVTLLTDKDGPYGWVDRDALSCVVARVLLTETRTCINEPGIIEQMILQHVAAAFGKSC